jgi:hypothetical protein
MRWLDRIPLAWLAIPAVLLALAPLAPEPHLLEKLRMLAAGELRRPIDVFDLLMHGGPLALTIAAGLRRLRGASDSRRGAVSPPRV